MHLTIRTFGNNQVVTAKLWGWGSMFCFVFLGGLNLSFNLIPNINHCHLPSLSPSVKKIWEKHGVPYNQPWGMLRQWKKTFCSYSRDGEESKGSLNIWGLFHVHLYAGESTFKIFSSYKPECSGNILLSSLKRVTAICHVSHSLSSRLTQCRGRKPAASSVNVNTKLQSKSALLCSRFSEHSG